MNPGLRPVPGRQSCLTVALIAVSSHVLEARGNWLEECPPDERWEQRDSGPVEQCMKSSRLRRLNCIVPTKLNALQGFSKLLQYCNSCSGWASTSQALSLGIGLWTDRSGVRASTKRQLGVPEQTAPQWQMCSDQFDSKAERRVMQQKCEEQCLKLLHGGRESRTLMGTTRAIFGIQGRTANDGP